VIGLIFLSGVRLTTTLRPGEISFLALTGLPDTSYTILKSIPSIGDVKLLAI
jgi:hypothetical protein